MSNRALFRAIPVNNKARFSVCTAQRKAAADAGWRADAGADREHAAVRERVGGGAAGGSHAQAGRRAQAHAALPALRVRCLQQPASICLANPSSSRDMPPEVEKVLGDEHSRRIKFIAAAQAASSLPLPSLPEVAMAGRSNVGKSSLINALTLSSVARQSDKPGVTQSLNFYDVNGQMSIVDMPGYGFAFAEAEKSARWNELMDDYLQGRGSVLKVRPIVW